MSADPDRWTIRTENGETHIYDGGAAIGAWGDPSPTLWGQLNQLVASANRPTPPPTTGVDWKMVAGLRRKDVLALYENVKDLKAKMAHMVEVGDDSPVVSATVVDVLTEKIEAQQVEILDLKARLLVNGNFIGERYDQARQHIKGLRVLADLYEQKLDGPPKD